MDRERDTSTPEAAVFAALSSRTRRAVLEALLDTRRGPAGPGEATPTFLAERTEIVRSQVSSALGTLLAAGIVAQRREGTRHFYRLIPERLLGVQRWLERFDAASGVFRPGSQVLERS